ncbi:MAG TPA: fatty acyl-AMP ligase [Acidimicrobiales bacterium]|nr:fatty acyl-AMP ligase [Acidimicrobiales bacterium]
MADFVGFTLPDRMSAAAQLGGVVRFVTGDAVDSVSWAQLLDDALRLAGSLTSRGVGPGCHVALLGTTSRALTTTIQATWLAGAAVMVLPLPMRLGSVDEFVNQTRGRIRAADVDLVVIDDDLSAFYDRVEGDPPMALMHDLMRDAATRRAASFTVPPISPDSLAVLQFTSGSTSDPKGVMLPHRTVVANLDGAGRALALTADDVAVSWLPLYHDMGLIGLFTLPMVNGLDLVLASPQDFMAAPLRWLEWISAFGGTATAGPNFSYALAGRALRRASGLDLSSWRIALNGAEPVNPSTVRDFCAAGAAFGLAPGSAFPAFGMAELAIAGTFPTPGRGLRVDAVDGRVLESDRYAAPVADEQAPGAQGFALLGRPIEGLEIRITDPETGSTMLEREVGELEIRGTSVTPGYYKRPDDTAAAFRGEWFRTGDLGYLVDGELALCGRIKDVIIVGGRNVFPEDVERAAERVEGVRPGNVIAFSVQNDRGKERLVVVAETKADDHAPIRAQVATRVREAVGLPTDDVVLVSPGSLPKTSSGKLQRSLCRTRYESDDLQPV